LGVGEPGERFWDAGESGGWVGYPGREVVAARCAATNCKIFRRVSGLGRLPVARKAGGRCK